MTRGIEIYFCESCDKVMSKVEHGFCNNGLCRACDEERENIYKDIY